MNAISSKPSSSIKFKKEQETLDFFQDEDKKEKESLRSFPVEEWKQIEEFGKRFQVSSFGRIMSLYELESKINGSKMLKDGTRIPLKQTIIINKTKEMNPKTVYVDGKFHGYKVSFQDPVDKKKKSISVAMAVAKAFLPNPLDRKRLTHKDGNKLNCRVDNLEWKAGNGAFTNKDEYIEYLKNADVGERKSEDITSAIIEYLEGNTSKIEEILGKNRTKIFRKCYWMVADLSGSRNCADLAEDLAQETLIKIYEKINKLMFHYPKNPVGWFIRIAQNTARNYIAKMSKEKLVEYKPGWGQHGKKYNENEDNDYEYNDYEYEEQADCST